MSTSGTKVPAIIDIPADIDPKIKRVLDSMKEASEIRLGRRGDPRDRAITLRELIDSGLAIELKDEPFNPNAGFGETDFALPTFLQPDPSAPVPPTPTGLSAGAAFTTITLDWDDPQISNLAFTEVWRNGSDNLGSATRVDTVSANVWSDTVDTAQTFYYWVRHVNTNTIAGAFSSSVNATTAQVNAARIQDAIIDNTKLVNKTLTNTKIADGTITSDILAANSVIAGKIATNAIVANDGVIGTAAIATAQIVDAAIVNAKIADLAVDSAKIANATITSAKIGTGEITTAKIDDAAITGAKIANATITDAKITGTLNANKIAANSVNGVLKGTAHSYSTIKVESAADSIISTIDRDGTILENTGGAGNSCFGYRCVVEDNMRFSNTFGLHQPYFAYSKLHNGVYYNIHLKRLGSLSFTVLSETEGVYTAQIQTTFFAQYTGDERLFITASFGTSGTTQSTFVANETNGSGATGTTDSTQFNKGSSFVDFHNMGSSGAQMRMSFDSFNLTAGTYHLNVWGGTSLADQNSSGQHEFGSTLLGVYKQHI